MRNYCYCDISGIASLLHFFRAGILALCMYRSRESSSVCNEIIKVSSATFKLSSKNWRKLHTFSSNSVSHEKSATAGKGEEREWGGREEREEKAEKGREIGGHSAKSPIPSSLHPLPSPSLLLPLRRKIVTKNGKKMRGGGGGGEGEEKIRLTELIERGVKYSYRRQIPFNLQVFSLFPH